MNLGRTTFIDEIVRKSESQALVRFRALIGKGPTIIPQGAGSPSASYVDIQSQIGGSEQSLQATTSLHYDLLREGKLCNII